MISYLPLGTTLCQPNDILLQPVAQVELLTKLANHQIIKLWCVLQCVASTTAFEAQRYSIVCNIQRCCLQLVAARIFGRVPTGSKTGL